MKKIGILAYGSLIEDPGSELEPMIDEIIIDVDTPFNIEFARTSRTRDHAPTVVPVDVDGAPVKAVILVLKDGVDLRLAKDLLWRRETRNEGSDRHYLEPENPTPNQIVIVEAMGLGGIDTVLYTKFGANINKPTSKKLARLAIKSTAGQAGVAGKDGISYLMSLKRKKIVTPLMAEYEAEILKSLGVNSLEAALKLLRAKANQNTES